MTLTSAAPTRLLTDDMLARFDQRAPVYDRENRFFDEDWAELRDSGYLLAAVPTELGGSDLNLAQVLALQEQLAYHAAPTALAVNMHLYWTGVAADLVRMGDNSCQWILEEAGRGEIFAALHGETGTELPIVRSTTKAERVDGGWRVTGRKIFGSLSPVWTYGGFQAQDDTGPDGPRLVHGFLRRDDHGVRFDETWDTLGMRATQSHDTHLDGVFVPDERCVLVCPTGLGGAGLFHGPLFAWVLLGFAAVYLGAARRAFDLTLSSAGERQSLMLTRSMAYHPEVQRGVADMRIGLDAAAAMLHSTARDWAEGAPHADWPIRLIGARHFVINQAFAIVDRAMELSGGSAAFKRNRLEQIFRDVRMGRFHPTNDLVTHELVGKMCLGINPDDPQRWG